MANKPPLLPFEILARVMHLAQIDGRIVLIVSGTFAIISAANHSAVGAIVGTLVAGTGAITLHSVGLLAQGEPRGIDWLVRSQLLLLATMLGYCSYRLTHIDLAELRARLTPEMITLIQNAYGLSVDQFLQLSRPILAMTYGIIGFVSIFYQGGMAIYYHRRRESVTKALTGESPETLERDEC